MSLLSRLFGGGATKEVEPAEVYNDCRIFPEPIAESGGHRICARIEKDFGEETKTHRMVRADTINSADEAAEFSVRKAKQVIDEQGDALFN